MTGTSETKKPAARPFWKLAIIALAAALVVAAGVSLGWNAANGQGKLTVHGGSNAGTYRAGDSGQASPTTPSDQPCGGTLLEDERHPTNGAHGSLSFVLPDGCTMSYQLTISQHMSSHTISLSGPDGHPPFKHSGGQREVYVNVSPSSLTGYGNGNSTAAEGQTNEPGTYTYAFDVESTGDLHFVATGT